MNQSELNTWGRNQVGTLIECGVLPKDAEDSVRRVLAIVGDGVDPNDLLPSFQDGNVDVMDEDIADARADWYARESIPTKFKRILDAREA